MNVRRAEFAGSWYPGSEAGCEREIKSFLSEMADKKIPAGEVVGGIVPHAGWFFSGSIACNVIDLLSRGEAPDTVVVFGMHLHPGSSRYIMAEGEWETPFGTIPVDEKLASELQKRFEFTVETPERFTRDNTIELQLPFIKYFFKDAKIVAMGTPPSDSSPELGKAVADISREMGIRVKVVGSTDMTHYGMNYGFSPKGSGPKALEWVRDVNDRQAIDAMLAMDPGKVIKEGLANHNACCPGAAAAAIAASKCLGAENAETLAYATSHDKSPGDSFVGYVGIVMSGRHK